MGSRITARDRPTRLWQTGRLSMQNHGSKRKWRVLASAASALCSAGCSIAGSWERVSVDPPGAPFPVDHVTFDRASNYTSTWTQDGEPRTNTGAYRWNGRQLKVASPGHEPRIYRGRLRLDGRLVLTYEEGGAKVQAVLERKQPETQSK